MTFICIQLGLASLFFKTSDECGIMFPSIATDGNFENVALTAKAADNLELQHVDLFEVSELCYYQSSTLLPLNYADLFLSDNIQWTHSLRSDQAYYQKLLC